MGNIDSKTLNNRKYKSGISITQLVETLSFFPIPKCWNVFLT